MALDGADYGWLMVYVGGAVVMFWALALVTEEKFVPALNAFATHAGIPPAVAGATLMAAGASSPELFGNVIAIFITHSELGVGTIIGSELFNHMVIAAGSIRTTPGGRPLALELGSTVRECGFYALSLFLLASPRRTSRCGGRSATTSTTTPRRSR